MTPKEFSAAIGGVVSVWTVREWCARGKLETVRGPGRPPYLIKPSELSRFRGDLRPYLVA